MSYLSENVIPGKHGKVFGTNAKNPEDLNRILEAIREIEGVADILLDIQKQPIEFTILTKKMVKIKTIENKVKALGFHVLPTGFFEI